MALTTPSQSPSRRGVCDYNRSTSPLERNSPSRSISNQKKKTDKGLPGQHYLFRPHRQLFPPRAWERKPATPFAPRSETQKIWKRAPLQSISVNQRLGREKDAVPVESQKRPVKKLRLNAATDEADTNKPSYQAMKWTTDMSPDKGLRRRKILLRRPLTWDSEEAQFASADVFANDFSQPILNDHGKGTTADAGIIEQINHHHNPATPTPASAAAALIDQPVVEPSWCYVLQKDNDESGNDVVSSPKSNAQEDPTTMCRSQSSAVLIKPDLMSSEQSAPSNVLSQELFLPMPEISDDTAYLHDFLSRARAQKTARLCQSDEVSAPLLLRTSPVGNTEYDDNFKLSTDEVITVAYAGILQPQLPTSENTHSEITISSPCRRSSRITKLNPQQLSKAPTVLTTLPSTITLKRLDGTEFISMQRESQSLALTTRANTKKNRGVAIPVPLKLMQLHAEITDDGEDCKGDHRITENGIVWRSNVTADDEAKSDDKRQRPKRGSNNKLKTNALPRDKLKAVSWDETLARFRGDNGVEVAVLEAYTRGYEPTTTTNTPESDSTLALGIQVPSAQPTTDPIPATDHVTVHEPNGIIVKASNSDQLPHGQREVKLPAPRVRKIRKASVGNVNGTPAPKKRSVHLSIASSSTTSQSTLDAARSGSIIRRPTNCRESDKVVKRLRR